MLHSLRIIVSSKNLEAEGLKLSPRGLNFRIDVTV